MTAPEPRRPESDKFPESDGPSIAPRPAAGDGAAEDGGLGEGVAPRRSGLRDPAAAVRGLGSGTLAMEAVVLLLAIQPVRLLAGDLRGPAMGVVVVLALGALLLAGSMRRRWAWTAGTGWHALLLASGLLHWSLGALGLVFSAGWAYICHVRRTILG